MTTILLLDSTPASELEFVRALLPDGEFEVVAPGPDGEDDLDELLSMAEVLITRSQPVTHEILDRATKIKLVQKYGARPDGLDLEAAEKAGVTVAVMPLRGCIAVAELAMTLILALSKQLVEAHAETVDGSYRTLGLEPQRTSQQHHAFQWMKLPNLQEIQGKTLGIVGFGEIGTEVAKRARAFEMEVIYYKRQPLPAHLDRALEVGSTSLDELLSASDFVTVHVPHSSATDPLIGSRELELMKASAYLINTSRGPVIDEEALISCLRDKHIAGAGLDVFVDEPLPASSELTRLDNVILTPHIGGGTGGAREKQMRDVLENVQRFISGGELHHRLV